LHLAVKLYLAHKTFLLPHGQLKVLICPVAYCRCSFCALCALAFSFLSPHLTLPIDINKTVSYPEPRARNLSQSPRRHDHLGADWSEL
jgi:hypothetical protein